MFQLKLGSWQQHNSMQRFCKPHRKLLKVQVTHINMLEVLVIIFSEKKICTYGNVLILS